MVSLPEGMLNSGMYEEARKDEVREYNLGICRRGILLLEKSTGLRGWSSWADSHVKSLDKNAVPLGTLSHGLSGMLCPATYHNGISMCTGEYTAYIMKLRRTSRPSSHALSISLFCRVQECHRECKLN